jgi:2-dehydropantoate 2-reductase
MTSTQPEYEFAILGAGALGSILGAHLARAGHSVVMLARGRRAEQIHTDGLRITGLSDLTVRVPTLTDHKALRSTGVLIVATKTPGTADALANLQQARLGAALSIQNGPLKNELLARAFGPDRVLGALADTSGELQPDGGVLFTRNVNLLVGELSGQLSERAGRIAGDIDSAGVRATAVTDIESLEWSKFVMWVGLVALSVTTRATTWRYLTDPGAARVLVRLIREMGRLASALKIAITDQAMLPSKSLCEGAEESAVARVMSIGRELELRAPGHRMSTLQDLESGRPLEVHETFGYALERAAQKGVQMPLVEAFYQVAAALDRLRVAPGAR